MSHNSTVIVIVGPTCSGKTELSIALAEKLNAEIIVCDSRAVYKGMDIGTAKPSKQEQARVQHHAIDLIEPNHFYTVAEYKNEATCAVKKIMSQGKMPMVVGGTGFYARALLEGIEIPEIAPSPELRAELAQIADQNGNLFLHNKLRILDPESADRIEINDRVRVIRAIEVSSLAGKPFSQLIKRIEPPFDTVWLGLRYLDRNRHKLKIENRFDEQMRLGLLAEIEKLYAVAEYCSVLNQAINYKEFLAYIEGRSSLDEVRHNCILDNYQLSRKQIIWFKANKLINWIDIDGMDNQSLLSSALAILANHRTQLQFS